MIERTSGFIGRIGGFLTRKHYAWGLFRVFALTLVLTSCSGNADYGDTVTVVNKMMSVFDSEGKGVVFSAEGEGQIENMYFCGDYNNWHHPGNTVLNVYCDDSLCVSGKLYELACLDMTDAGDSDYPDVFLETPLFSKLGSHNSINLDFKIPYHKSCKVELVQAEPGTDDCVWTTVRANTKIDIVCGGRRLPKNARFKGIKADNLKVKSGDQFVMMESGKKSMLIGVNLFVDSETECSMEACIRACDTRNDNVQLLSSGLEDFFLGTYYFDSGQFMRYKCGLTRFKVENGGLKLSAYRQFPDNPLCFSHPVKLTVRNGEQNGIDSSAPLTDDICFFRGDATIGAICYYYEW